MKEVLFTIFMLIPLFVSAVETDTELIRRMQADGYAQYVADAPYVIENVEYDIENISRFYNFDGKNNFLNPTTKRSDYAVLQANGLVISGPRITNSGVPNNIIKFWDPDSRTEGIVTVVQVHSTDKVTSGGYRSQLSSYQLRPYINYRWSLRFKFDKSWDMNSEGQEGILWQIKGLPKKGQSGNPVIGLALVKDQLFIGWSYPFFGKISNEQLWTWTDKDYGPQDLPRYKVTPGVYYDIEFEYFADDRINGKGYFKAKINGESWCSFVGPTLHPDQLGPHYMAFGWYQWKAAPKQTRKIYWVRNRAFVKN